MNSQNELSMDPMPVEKRISNLTTMIMSAKTDDLIMSNLVENNKKWILKSAYQATGRYVSENDDEWSVALIAFSEAVRKYQSDKGSFHAFASVVIKRRLYDYLKTEGRHRNVIFVAPEVFSGEMKNTESDRTGFRLQGQLMKAEREADREDFSERAREEIEEMQEILSQYGFSFFDLASSSPKAENTKKNCARAICTLIASTIMMLAMRMKRKLPAKDLSERSGVTRKLLDRYRRYIIAAAEILDGPFPILGSYLEYVRKEGAV